MSRSGHPKEEKALQPRQIAAIAALLTERDVASAAAKANVPLGTLRRWLASDELFKARLHEAERQALDSVTRKLTGTAELAVDIIRGIMLNKETPVSVRLRAATVILEQLLRLRELTSLEERLSALEAYAGGGIKP